MADTEQKQRIMDILRVSAQEADEILAYDKLVEQGKPTPYDFTKEQEKATRKYRQADRKRPNYQVQQRERKPNELKELIISTLATFLGENSGFSSENVEITNKNRMIAFSSGGKRFELTLVEKREPKK